MRAALATILAAGGLLTAGCVDNEAVVFIEGAQPLLSPDCRVDAADNDFSSNGTFDLLGGSGYTAVLKVRTNLPSTFSGQDVAQGRTQSPNYPNYGGADNNVVIFNGAEIEYSFVTDQLTSEKLVATATREGFTGELECRAAVEGDLLRTCTLGKRTVALSGSVFNTQTSLNGASAIATQAFPPDLGIELARLYKQTATDAGTAATNLALLTAPTDRQRVIASVALLGQTTGNGDLRSLKTFAFPYPVDLCLGCLIPDQSFCADREAVAAVVNTDGACIAGVDIAVTACFCEGETAGEPGPVRVDSDENVCRTAAP